MGSVTIVYGVVLLL